MFDADESLEASGLFELLSANPEDSERATFLTECKIKWAEIVAAEGFFDAVIDAADIMSEDTTKRRKVCHLSVARSHKNVI